MRKFKRLTMTLALLIMAVGGAWAQSTLNVVEFEVPAGWATDNNPVTAADLPGFKAVTLDEAKAWTGAPAGYAILFYSFDGNKINLVNYANGGVISDGPADFTKKTVFDNKSNGKFYYTATEPTEWSLKPDETGKKWILANMPASNIELQVEYFAESNLFLSKEALADAANIAVKAGKLGVQFGEDGKSANTITEGTAMTVTYNGTKKILGMKVEKMAVAEGHALTSAKFGEIVCSDGKAYAAADKDNLPKGVKAEALVCYVDGEHGLALAMADVKNEKMSWDNDRGANDGKTAAEWCTGWNTSHPITGATWLLASKTQWSSMISAAGSASNLSNAFSAVGGTNLQAYSYWSSTPNIGVSAWRYHFPSSSWSWTYLNQDNTGSYIRACLEW